MIALTCRQFQISEVLWREGRFPARWSSASCTCRICRPVSISRLSKIMLNSFWRQVMEWRNKRLCSFGTQMWDGVVRGTARNCVFVTGPGKAACFTLSATGDKFRRAVKHGYIMVKQTNDLLGGKIIQSLQLHFQKGVGAATFFERKVRHFQQKICGPVSLPPNVNANKIRPHLVWDTHFQVGNLVKVKETHRLFVCQKKNDRATGFTCCWFNTNAKRGHLQRCAVLVPQVPSITNARQT